MATKNLGAVTAYAYAKAGGYTGTEEEFQTLMAALPDSVEDAQEAVSTVTGLTAQATKVVSTAPARATYNKIANRIDFEIPEGNGIASVALTSTSGAVKTYTITFDDGTTTTFDVTDGEVTQEVFEEAITELDEKKANYDGYYDEMTVGTAEQLISSATIEDDELYVFRSAGGTNDIGNRETDMLVGGTVAWNQLVQNVGKTTVTNNGVTFTANADGTIIANGTASGGDAVFTYAVIDYTANHKYACLGVPSGASSATYCCILLGAVYADTIKAINIDDYFTSRILVKNGATVNNVKFNPLCIDLTAMFGTEIADYIYSLEQAEAGKGVAWFRKYFPKPYYAYDTGSLQSVNVASHDLTGFNQWDEEWELGSYNISDGSKYTTADRIRSRNSIDVLPNTAYYLKSPANVRVLFYEADGTFINAPNNYMDAVFTTPANCGKIAFFCSPTYGTTYKGDICINRVWTGYRNGEYEEYVKHSYPYDESVQLRGIPQLVDGELKYDGDTYESSGKVTRKYGIRNLGEVTWMATSGCYIYSPTDAKQKFKGLISGKLVKVNKDYSDLADGEWTSSGGANLSVWVKNTMAESPAAFKTLMSGIYLIYEKETPTEETADPFTNPQIVDDFGTEEYVDAGVKNGTRDVAIPVGHATQYMANLRDKLQHLPSLASSDGDYVIGQSGTSMSLKPLAPYFNAEHPNLTAGSANQLLSTITIEDQTPYKFRTSGGSVDIGDRETDMIVGGTIAWNQLALIASSARSFSKKGIDVTDNRDGTYTVNGTATATTTVDLVATRSWAANHRYVFWGCPPNGSESTYSLRMLGAGGDTAEYGNGALWNPGTTTWKGISVKVMNGVTVNNLVFRPVIFDLTQMFGSTIADYIYSLEQANRGAGVSFFRSLFPKPYYEYNVGELLSVSGLQSHDMRGFNAWDEEWESGTFNTTTGANINTGLAANQIRTKNPIPVIPNTAYYVKTPKPIWCIFYDADLNVIVPPKDGNVIGWDGNSLMLGDSVRPASVTFTMLSGAYYMRFYCQTSYGNTYKNDICINLSWDGERDGEYEPYTVNSYALDDSLTLRGIPKLDASSNLYYDGDTYESDGTVTRKYGVVDLGMMNWSYQTPSGTSYFLATSASEIADMETYSGYYKPINAFCVKYVTGTTNSAPQKDKELVVTINSARLRIRDDSFNGDVDAFKSSLAGVYLVYKKKTPTTESAEPYTNPQIVDDFGTEEYVTDSIVPVGHVTQYQPNLRAKLEMAPNSPDGDGDYIVRQTNGTNEYVELVIPNELPDIPTMDGSYTLRVTVSDGAATLSWVSNT